MKAIQPYLMFNGNCREAMNFYTDAMDADLHIMDGEQAPNTPDDKKELVLHAMMRKGSSMVLASDVMQGEPAKFGTNFSLSIDCESTEEQEKLFAALKEGGTVTMALQDTFWGARFGIVTDKFGVSWMFNFDYGKHS